MSFCTAINCIDGRTQIPAIEYLQRHFGADNVDIISEAGPVQYLAGHKESEETRSIIRRVNISIDAHDSQGIAIIAHDNCAGNPATAALQRKQLYKAVTYLSTLYPERDIVGLWIDDEWKVNEICTVEGLEGTEGARH